jgi:predicted DNA-binding transcriptional regulator AlpA
MITENIQLISRKQLVTKLTVSLTTLKKLEKKPTFPKRVILGPNRIAYKLIEIEEWINRNQVA